MKPLPPTSAQVTESRYAYPAAMVRSPAGLTVRCAGRERCDPDFKISRDDFPCYGLECVVSGAGELVLDGHPYPLHAGMVFCYGPGIRHRIINRPGHRMTKYFVDFWGDEAHALLGQGSRLLGRATQVVEVETWRGLFEQLIDEGARKSALSAQVCAAYLRVLLLKAGEGVRPTAPGETSLLRRFQTWRDFIAANHLRLRGLDDAAGALGVRPAYLCRVFRQFGHPSPARYLTQVKMNRAADLLISNRPTVKGVAYQLGYDDPYHFSRLFKRHFGHSPANFLEQHRRVRGESRLEMPRDGFQSREAGRHHGRDPL